MGFNGISDDKLPAIIKLQSVARWGRYNILCVCFSQVTWKTHNTVPATVPYEQGVGGAVGPGVPNPFEPLSSVRISWRGEGCQIRDLRTAGPTFWPYLKKLPLLCISCALFFSFASYCNFCLCANPDFSTPMLVMCLLVSESPAYEGQVDSQSSCL